MSEATKRTLKEFIKVKHGFAFPGSGITSDETSNILVTPGNFNYGGGFKGDKFKYFNGEIPQEYVFKGGEIIVTMTDLSQETDTLGYSAKVPFSETKQHLHNQRVGLVQFVKDGLFPDYCYWLMRTSDYHESIVNSASGTSIMHTSPDRICAYEFLLPPLPEQQAIAEVLSSLDDKIDLLHRNNKTLEQMTETLFRQWFVIEAKEEWEEKKVSEIIEIRDGTHDSPKQADNGRYLVTSKNLRPNEIDFTSAYKISEADYHLINKRSVVEEGDILISMIGTLGLLHLVVEKPDYAIKNIGLFKSSQKPWFSRFLLLLLKSPVGKNYIYENADGSTQEYISLGSLRKFSFNYPGEEIIRAFDNQVEPLLNKVKHNSAQIRTLSKTRDTLLPKLMSGQVRVKTD